MFKDRIYLRSFIRAVSDECVGTEANLGENAMSRLSWAQKLYWTRFGKPAQERALVKFLIETPISSLTEIGIGNASRSKRIAQLVSLADPSEKLRYIGIDEFESSRDGKPHLSLKQAHQLASQLGFKASLIPGDHSSAVPRVANKMGPSDLVIIDGGFDPATPTVGAIAPWLVRLTHENSTIFASAEVGGALIQVPNTFHSETVQIAA